MKSHKFWQPFISALTATPFCLLAGWTSAGAGHGDYILATILFPFTMLLFGFSDSFTASVSLGVIPAIVQFPLYGIILGLANLKNRLDVSLAVILVTHILAIFACFLFLGERFYDFLARI